MARTVLAQMWAAYSLIRHPQICRRRISNVLLLGEEGKSHVLHESSGALKGVLVEMRVLWVLDDAEDGDKSPEHAHISGNECLVCGDDVTHRACALHCINF